MCYCEEKQSLLYILIWRSIPTLNTFWANAKVQFLILVFGNICNLFWNWDYSNYSECGNYEGSISPFKTCPLILCDVGPRTVQMAFSFACWLPVRLHHQEELDRVWKARMTNEWTYCFLLVPPQKLFVVTVVAGVSISGHFHFAAVFPHTGKLAS